MGGGSNRQPSNGSLTSKVSEFFYFIYVFPGFVLDAGIVKSDLIESKNIIDKIVQDEKSLSDIINIEYKLFEEDNPVVSDGMWCKICF